MPEESITISSDVSPAEQLSTNGILNFNQGLANILAIEQLGKSVTYSPAPEPGSVILLSSGLGALAIIRIRQRASDLLAFEIFSALTVDLAGALTIARTQPRSTGQMRGIGESAHVQPQLRDQRSGRNAFLRPGSAPSCGRGFTSSIVNLPSHTFQPGFPYTLVDSIATCVRWLENSHSINRRKLSENVPNSRFFFVFRPASSSNHKYATTVCSCTSQPQQRRCTASIQPPSAVQRRDA
jgi:hypothetical protein